MLESTDGPQEHARTACPQGHRFVLSIEALTRPSRRRVVDRPPRRIMLLCSAFNGLTQRVWIELRAAGHEVVVQQAGDDEALRAAMVETQPDLVICPFLRDRVPAEVWTSRPTIVIHPGPKGDRGPSSLDWAIMDAEPVWGVTALQAVQELDAGPIWASRTFAVGPDAPRKSTLYNGPVTDAAVAVGARGGGQGDRPRIRAGAAGLHPARRPRACADPGPPRRPRLLLVRSHRAHAAPHPCRRRRTRCGHPLVRDLGRRLRRPPRARQRRRARRRTRHGRRASPRCRARAHRRRRDLDRSSALPRGSAGARPQASRDDRPRRPPRRGSRG